MSAGRPVLAEVEGVMSRAPFPALPDAAAALLTVVRGLRIGAQQRRYVEGCLAGAGAAEYMQRMLDREGSWSLTVYVVDGSGDGARWVSRAVRIVDLAERAGPDGASSRRLVPGFTDFLQGSPGLQPWEELVLGS